MATMNIDTNSLADGNTLEPIPAGKYLCEIIESDVVSIKNGDVVALKLTLQVVDGDFNGRKIWDHINYKHSNFEAQQIGEGKIKSICRAVGFEGELRDSTVLHSAPLMVRVVVDDEDPKYRPKNKVKGYSAAPTRNAPAQQQRSPTTTAQRPAATQSAPIANARQPASAGAKPGFMQRE